MLSPGQAADVTSAAELIEGLEFDALLADKGYDADWLVDLVEATHHAEAVIPPRKGRKNPRDYDKHTYKQRNPTSNATWSRGSSAGPSTSAASPPAMRKPLVTSWPSGTSPPSLSGLSDCQHALALAAKFASFRTATCPVTAGQCNLSGEDVTNCENQTTRAGIEWFMCSE